MLYCPNFFWNVLQVWMTGKDVYLQMTWSWPDKTWNILCSYCLQWNTSQSKFRNHYFLFLFAFSILSQLFLIWGCTTMPRSLEEVWISDSYGLCGWVSSPVAVTSSTGCAGTMQWGRGRNLIQQSWTRSTVGCWSPGAPKGPKIWNTQIWPGSRCSRSLTRTRKQKYLEVKVCSPELNLVENVCVSSASLG